MDGQFDVAGLAKWVVGKGLGVIEEKTGLELQAIAEPIAKYGMNQLALAETVELGIPLTFVFAVIANTFKKQKEQQQVRS